VVGEFVMDGWNRGFRRSGVQCQIWLRHSNSTCAVKMLLRQRKCPTLALCTIMLINRQNIPLCSQKHKVKKKGIEQLCWHKSMVLSVILFLVFHDANVRIFIEICKERGLLIIFQ
jgi:hypothetical protein